MKNKITCMILSTALLLISSCGRNGHTKNSRDYSSAESADGIAQEETTQETTKEKTSSEADQAADIRNALVDYGFRDFSQIYYTMATVTGIDPNNPGLRATYEAQLLSLPPPGNDIKSFAAAHQSAIFKMGVEFCHVLMDTPDLRVKILPTFDFSAALNTAFTGTKKKEVALALINQFWGTGLEGRPNYDEAANTVVALIDEITADTNSLGSIAQGLRGTNVVKGACTAVITSLPSHVL